MMIVNRILICVSQEGDNCGKTIEFVMNEPIIL